MKVFGVLEFDGCIGGPSVSSSESSSSISLLSCKPGRSVSPLSTSSSDDDVEKTGARPCNCGKLEEIFWRLILIELLESYRILESEVLVLSGCLFGMSLLLLFLLIVFLMC